MNTKTSGTLLRSYWKNNMKFQTSFVALLALSLPAFSQTTYYTNPNGVPTGQAQQMGNTTYYSNPNGVPIGQAQQVGNTTYYSNPNGMPVGQAQTMSVPTQPTAPLTPKAPLSPPTMFNQQ
jgi:hypothetical protein